MPSLGPGDALPGFRIEEFVESGATSEVYRASALDTGTPVAIKLLHPAWRSMTMIRSRFEHEGRMLLELHHPHIIRALALGAGPDSLPFLALEWAPNDLRKHLQFTREGIAFQTALRLASQLADALCALHSHRLVHRDLKPANILLTSLELADAQVKLADLGLVKHLPESHVGPDAALERGRVSTARGTRLGTWEYMAPELWSDAKNANPNSDVYGLGCLLSHLLTGQPLYPVADEHSLMFHHLFEPPPLNNLDDRTPNSLVDLIARMLTKKSEGRPVMAEVHRELVMMAAPS